MLDGVFKPYVGFFAVIMILQRQEIGYNDIIKDIKVDMK